MSFAIFPEHIEFLANFSKNYIKKDGSISLENNLDLGTNKIINITTPTVSTDAANKAYVDAVVTGGVDNIELTGYLKLESNTIISEPSGDTYVQNTETGKVIKFETDAGAINFSVDKGVSNSLSLSSSGVLTVDTDIIFAETLGLLSKTSSHEICMMYNGGLTTDTDYAIKQNNTGHTTINAKSTESISMSVNDTEYINISSSLATVKNDLDVIKDSNDGNPIIGIGSSAAEIFQIQSLYDTGGVALDKIKFTTKTASTTANKGSMEFYVDESLIVSIVDDSLDIASGNQLKIGGSSVLTSTVLGSTVLSSSLTSIGTLSSLTLSGSITQTDGDILLYDSNNDGNPSVAIGSSSTETLSIQSIYDSGATTLEKVTFMTKAASATADKGLMEFYIDESLILSIDDDALNLATGKQLEINGTSILTSTTLGSTVTTSSLQSVGTLSSITVSGNSDLEGYVSIGNGSSLNVNTGLIIDYDNTYDSLGRQLFVAGTVTAAVNTNAYGVHIAPEEIKVPGSSTSALITSLYVDEPNINELVSGGSSVTTLATSVYIADAPTEGATNYSLYVNSGSSYLNGDLTATGITTLNQVTINTTNGDFKIYDGTNTSFEVNKDGGVF